MPKETCYEFENSDIRREVQDQIEKIIAHPGSAISSCGSHLWINTSEVSHVESDSVGKIVHMAGGHFA